MNFNKIDQKKIVLMDVFNTIIIRSIPDEEVKLLWAEHLIEYYNAEISPRQLYYERRLLERESSIISLIQGHSRQCNIDWVIKKIWKKYFFNQNFIDFKEKSKAIELQIEIQNDFLCHEWEKWIRKYCDSKIILVSDYYYGSEYIMKLLIELHAPINCVKKIYVSCEYGKTKKNGNLYNVVLSEEKIEPNQCIMIGDNETSDYENAMLNGIESFLINNKKVTWQYCEPRKTKDYILTHFDDSPFQRISFLFYEFIRKLHEKLKSESINTVLFFSREGEFLIQLFRSYQATINDYSINANYFYVSRQATYLPSLKDYTEVDLNKYLDIDDKISVDYLTYDLNIQKAAEWNRLFPKGTITREEYLSSNEFKKIINKEIEIQKENFTRYLKSLGVVQGTEFAVVDIGYLGKAQNHIYEILGRQTKIIGLYLFLMKSHYEVNDMNQKFGLIFDEYNDDKQNCYCMNKGILEDILLASHGSTIKYVKKGDDVTPLFCEVPTERETFVQYISPIQDKILKNFKMIAAVYQSTHSEVRDFDKFHKKMYSKFIYTPTVREMEIYRKIPHVHNYGRHTTEYPKERKNNIGIMDSVKNFVKILTTKGEIIRDQKARWLPLAFYILNLNWINKILHVFSPITLTIIDMDFKRRHKNL